MTRLETLLLLLVLGLVGADAILVPAHGVRLDGPAYAGVALLSATLVAGGVFYRRFRPEPSLAQMMLGSAFLCAFSAAAAMLNYLLLAVAGPRIDAALAGWDRALGFSWPAVMALAAAHPGASTILFLAYSTMLPQLALLVIALARRPEGERALRFCLAIALGALICIAVWTLRPSFGALSVYALDPALVRRLNPVLDPAYGRELSALLANGPGYISPTAMKGLIGFPSYHAVLALIVSRFAWDLRGLRWPVLALNLLVLISVPVEGGHHLVDLLAAFPVAWAAIAMASRATFAPQMRGLVNKARLLTTPPARNTAFRAEMAKVRPCETLCD